MRENYGRAVDAAVLVRCYERLVVQFAEVRTLQAQVLEAELEQQRITAGYGRRAGANPDNLSGKL